jgi:hypothetical protein
MSVFPSGLDAFTNKLDNVDTVYAADMNAVQSGVSAIQTTVGTMGAFNFVPTAGGSISGSIFPTQSGTLNIGSLPLPLAALYADALFVSGVNIGSATRTFEAFSGFSSDSSGIINLSITLAHEPLSIFGMYGYDMNYNYFAVAVNNFIPQSLYNSFIDTVGVAMGTPYSGSNITYSQGSLGPSNPFTIWVDYLYNGSPVPPISATPYDVRLTLPFTINNNTDAVSEVYPMNPAPKLLTNPSTLSVIGGTEYAGINGFSLQCCELEDVQAHLNAFYAVVFVSGNNVCIRTPTGSGSPNDYTLAVTGSF